MSECPCCGQTLPIKSGMAFIDKYRSVIKGGKCAELTGLQYEIITRLRRRPMTIAELIEDIYADRRDGGPDTAKSVMACTIRAMNHRLAPLEIRIGAERKGAHGPLTKILPLHA